MKANLSVLLILSSISNLSFSQEIYASKSGPFKKFDTCKLTQNSGVIELGNGYKHKFIETTKYANNEIDFLHLIEPAIASKENEFYRWFSTQTDYFAQTNGELVKFFASGFSNIRNNSVEAITLIERIDEICDTVLEDFRIIGNFKINLKIGNRTFLDYFKIERLNSPFGSRISGEYKVPNSFTSNIKNIKYDNGKFSFVIRVQEGQDDYETVFEGTFDQKDKISGSAYILPARKLLGTFTGIKTNENNI